MKDKWTTGPKFKEYLKMNFRLVMIHYAFALLFSVFGLELLAFLLMGPALIKLYSETLYHKQACLYQSVPVSSFETVLVKTVVGAAGVLLAAVGFMKFDLLYILRWIPLAFMVCGIALFGVAVGNRARGNRDKKPNAATAVLVIGGMLLVIYGIFWVLEQIRFASPLMREVLGLAGSSAGAVLMFWLNVRALDKWYSI